MKWFVVDKDRQTAFLQSGPRLELVLPTVWTTREITRNWRELQNRFKHNPPSFLLVQAEQLIETKSAGISFLKLLEEECKNRGIGFQLQSLSKPLEQSLRIAEKKSLLGKTNPGYPLKQSEAIGKMTLDSLEEFRNLITFTGELAQSFVRSLRHPSTVRWKDCLVAAESMGVNAFFIIAMIGFLLGLIMSFQSAIPMQRFGAEIFVANLVGLSLFRELGPLMTAFILAGRSGSAFAAELGTMKVSEEVDALTTMGLPPVQFLVIPRLFASILMTPLLTVVFNLFGLLGGSVVLMSFGFPFITFVNQVNIAVGFSDIMGGMLKSYFFGMIIASIGCYRGLRTSSGAGAVGESTTAAVVGSIILVSLLDGVFSVLYFYLKI